MFTIRYKVKAAKDMAEVDQLHLAAKVQGAMADVVEVVNQHGLESPEFLAVYDHCATVLNLAPRATVTWPPHVRPRHDVGWG